MVNVKVIVIAKMNKDVKVNNQLVLANLYKNNLMEYFFIF
jgi:hypothetical protein